MNGTLSFYECRLGGGHIQEVVEMLKHLARACSLPNEPPGESFTTI